jgi:hypothetical protein
MAGVAYIQPQLGCAAQGSLANGLDVQLYELLQLCLHGPCHIAAASSSTHVHVTLSVPLFTCRRQAILANVMPTGLLIGSTHPRTGVEELLAQTQQQLAQAQQQLAQAQQQLTEAQERAAHYEGHAIELEEQVALLKVFVGDLEGKLAQQG